MRRPATTRRGRAVPARAGHHRSIGFYELFGLRVRNSYAPDGRQVWCWMQDGDARMMLAAADEPVDAGQQAMLLWLYARELDGLHARLTAAGLSPGPISAGAPGPDRAFDMSDPDGYRVMVTDADAVHPPARR